MGRFRLYPKKSNSIANGFFEDYNSAYNPGVILWYGGSSTRQSISRHLVEFDLTELQQKINSKEINPDFVSSYRLKYKNVVPSGELLSSDFEFAKLNKKIATSFDLIAFPINKFWDEGRGYDLIQTEYIHISAGDTNLTGYSNWNNSTQLVSWDEPGVYSNPTASTSLWSTQHFDRGDEDIDMDITEIVNNWLYSGLTNYGLALGFSKEFEDISGSTRYMTRYYSEKTNTAFKPYIEVIFDNQVIEDKRNAVSNNKLSRIFLHLFSGNSTANYFSAGTVDIKTVSGVDVITGLTPTQLTKGSYYVDILMSGATKGQKYKDVWNGITFEPGVDVQNFEQFFQIQGNYYTNTPKEVNQYVVDTYGISNNEILKKGEVVRIYADARMEYSTKAPTTDYGLEYRMTLNNITEIIPWSKSNYMIIDNCAKFFFDIDTTWLLDNQNYQIELRINDLGTKRVLPEKLYFSIAIE
jgi:hypothetical protein